MFTSSQYKQCFPRLLFKQCVTPHRITSSSVRSFTRYLSRLLHCLGDNNRHARHRYFTLWGRYIQLSSDYIFRLDPNTLKYLDIRTFSWRIDHVTFVIVDRRCHRIFYLQVAWIHDDSFEWNVLKYLDNTRLITNRCVRVFLHWHLTSLVWWTQYRPVNWLLHWVYKSGSSYCLVLP